MKNDELAAHYLARNMEVFKNVEDDPQKTLQIYRDYTTLAARSGGPAGMKKWVEKAARGDQFALQVFQCADDLRFFDVLNMFGDTYHNTATFAIKFVRSNLHGLSGGVSCDAAYPVYAIIIGNVIQIIVEVLERLAHITRGLFSQVPNFEMDDDALAKHTDFVESLNATTGGPTKAAIEKARNTTIRVWKSILQPRPKLNAMDDLFLRRLPGRTDGLSVMDLVDEVFRGLEFGKREFFLTETEAWNDALDRYFDEIHTIIVDEVVQGVMDNAGSRVVAENIGTVFNWVRLNHSPLYYHGRLPLLSPSVLTTTIQVFNGIGEGIAEVRSRYTQIYSTVMR